MSITGRMPSIPVDVRERIVAEFDKLKSDGVRNLDRKIAQTFGLSRGGVNLILMQAGRKDTAHNAETVRTVMALASTGLSNEVIAHRANIKPSTVSMIKGHVNMRELLQPARQSYPDIIAHRKFIASRWKPGRYVVGNDMHIKFHSYRVVDAINSLKGDYDGFIMAGDLVDAYWISSFRKSHYHSFAAEIAVATDVMTMFAKKFGRVLYFHGNHEDRLWKDLLNRIQPAAETAKEASHILYDAVDQVKRWYYGNMVGVDVHYGWFVQVGKVMISHADLYSQMQGRTAQNILEHFLENQKIWQIDDIDTVMEAHLHRHDGPKRKFGRFIWELPSMCGPLDYQLGARVSRNRQDSGFSIMTLKKDGSLDFNQSRSFYVDTTGEFNEKEEYRADDPITENSKRPRKKITRRRR